MRTIAQNIKTSVVRYCLGFLLVPGSLSVCQARCAIGHPQSGLDLRAVTPVQSSAPALEGWEWSGGDSESIGVANMKVVDFVPALNFSIAPPVAPLADQRATPLLSQPEPSSISLMLAGSAIMLRYGRRKRSN
jgi:hypothetical protein